MSDAIFRSFLLRQHAEGQRLTAGSDIVAVTPVPGSHPPNRYVAAFSCAGLAREHGEIVVWHRWAVGIFFPEDYLRRPPDLASLLTYLGAAEEPWHPNLHPPFVCLHAAPGAALVEIVMGLFELLTWNTYSTADSLNPAAAQWARQQPSTRFPLERRPLRRRGPPAQVHVTISHP